MIAEINSLQKKYCSRAMLLALGAAAVLILLGAKPIAKGLLFQHHQFCPYGSDTAFEAQRDP